MVFFVFFFCFTTIPQPVPGRFYKSRENISTWFFDYVIISAEKEGANCHKHKAGYKIYALKSKMYVTKIVLFNEA